MKRRSIFVFIASIFALLVPTPGRFVYGFTLVIELNLIMLVGTFSLYLIKKLNLEKIDTITILFLIISTTIFYRQIIIMICPEIMLSLGFIIYLLPVSFFIIGYVFENQEESFQNKLIFNMKHCLTFSVFVLIYFLFRDLAGYGTFTFFGPNHQILEKVIIPAEKISFTSIFASIPGSLMLCSILLFIHIYVRNKIAILKNAEDNK